MTCSVAPQTLEDFCCLRQTKTVKSKIYYRLAIKEHQQSIHHHFLQMVAPVLCSQLQHLYLQVIQFKMKG
jgi:hypothetical protein